MTKLTIIEIRARRRFATLSSLAMTALALGLFFVFQETATEVAMTYLQPR